MLRLWRTPRSEWRIFAAPGVRRPMVVPQNDFASGMTWPSEGYRTGIDLIRKGLDQKRPGRMGRGDLTGS